MACFIDPPASKAAFLTTPMIQQLTAVSGSLKLAPAQVREEPKHRQHLYPQTWHQRRRGQAALLRKRTSTKQQRCKEEPTLTTPVKEEITVCQWLPSIPAEGDELVHARIRASHLARVAKEAFVHPSNQSAI